MNDTGRPPAAPAPVRVGELLRLAGPVVASRLAIMAMGLTDTLVVGRFSARELAYHALGWSLTSIVLVGGIGLLVGTQVLTARHRGAGRPHATAAVLRRGLRHAVVIGLVATIGLLIGGPPLLRATLPPDLAAGAIPPMRIFALSLTPYLVADALIFWFEGHERPGRPAAALWLANAVNLALALWLVPGRSPFGVEGAVAAGWATLGARTFLMLVLLGMLVAWRPASAWGVFRRQPAAPAEASEQRRIGGAAGASYLLEAGGFSLLNLVAGQVSAAVVAAWAVVGNVASIVFMLPLGLANATGVLVARCVGAGDAEGVGRAFRLGLGLAVGSLAFVSLGLLGGAAMVARLYTADPAVLALLPQGLALGALFFMADGAQVVAAHGLRARGDIWWPTAVHGLAYVVVMLPLAWGLAVGWGWGLSGILWAVIAASLLSAAALVARFRALGVRLPGEAAQRTV
ncbi:MAG: MATE family efflux transporter [Sphingomonadaceae bacterium]|uniref:MATE family efflux transporter n=1 Tax=Thermaurantiacus sp. TaxID=2820283 RepID=UPI00298ED3A2|nr:MATE family efflux transporter [Thermaurantiacus sp.]MCS6986323.1 MATE family efflux transporter [Sphingomonadaceae bacterium]MDW8414415.1 MATE family efflux transporter [Thermaurantiacus sp.]